MWCHLPTVIRRVLVLLVLALTTMIVAFTTTLIFAHASHAIASTTKTINFQGRLLTASGAVVPDGNYNIQFKIYQGGTGAAAGNPDGTLDWTESYVNGNSTGVQVKDGFLSVNLGSINTFGTSVDWSQDNLWLSMNVAGSSAGCSTFGTSPCTADGEMLPMKQITATPYAINSSQLGGITSDGFIHNGTTQQTGDFNVSGNGTANTLQGNTSVLGPLLDTSVTNGTLNIGTTNAYDINIGQASSVDSTITIGGGNGNKTLVLGSNDGASLTRIQGGNGGVSISTSGTGGFFLHDYGNNFNPLAMVNDSFNFNLGSSSYFRVNDNTTSTGIFEVNQDKSIVTGYGSAFTAQGTATFNQGITVQGTGSLQYVTPGGASLSTAINIPNYTVGAYSSVLSFGLPSTSAATARGLLIADGRTAAHQSTIGVLSPDENSIMGLSWNGSNSTGTLSNTASTLALQGNGLNLLTATNASGQANVGIGNAATSGYALDVTGDVNSSSQYRINGSVALSSTALNFGGTSTSTITSASAQSLNINGSTGVTIQTNGVNSASFNNTNIQIGTGSGLGTPTLLTLDNASSAPTVNSSLLGSMYYNTTLGKVQCYEATGWGPCGASPDTFVSLSPEYANAVMHTTGTGTMSSDFCSSDLGINDGTSSQPTVCGTHETYNYYHWTSSDPSTTQTRSIYVTYQLPSNFDSFVSGSTSLMALTDSTNATVSYNIYRSNSSGVTACGTGVTASTGAQTSWQKSVATAAEPASCSFAAGDSIVFKINLGAQQNANAYVSNLNFAYKSQ